MLYPYIILVKWKNMYISRILESKIKLYLNKPEFIAVIGPRQSGKTTMLKKIQAELKESIYLSFEDMKLLESFEEDISTFAKEYSKFKYVFIDEFQYSKNGGKRLKYLFDFFPGTKIIISGSSALDLTINAVKYLAGRILVFNLFQLSFEEFLSYRDKSLYNIFKKLIGNYSIKSFKAASEIKPVSSRRVYDLLNEFLIWGGYPRVVISKTKEEKKEILRNIYNTYFIKDIRDVLGLIDDFKLSKLIKAISLQTGSIISYNELSQISGYDFLTLKKYLGILEKTFICKIVHPFSGNKRNELKKNPKVYFYDTGLRNYILDDFKVNNNYNLIFIVVEQDFLKF